MITKANENEMFSAFSANSVAFSDPLPAVFFCLEGRGPYF